MSDHAAAALEILHISFGADDSPRSVDKYACPYCGYVHDSSVLLSSQPRNRETFVAKLLDMLPALSKEQDTITRGISATKFQSSG